jgi:hypothetical protein
MNVWLSVRRTISGYVGRLHARGAVVVGETRPHKTPDSAECNVRTLAVINKHTIVEPPAELS